MVFAVMRPAHRSMARISYSVSFELFFRGGACRNPTLKHPKHRR